MYTKIKPEDEQFIRDSFSEVEFHFAKTMAAIPHSYTRRREWKDDADFVRVVSLIRAHGYQKKFFTKIYTYLDLDGYSYWSMGFPVEETVLINKAEVK